MWPYAAAVVVGALWANRSKPRTAARKVTLLGAKTGNTYQAEEFPGPGFVVIYGAGAQVVYRRSEAGQLVFVKAKGNQGVIQTIRTDIERDA